MPRPCVPAVVTLSSLRRNIEMTLDTAGLTGPRHGREWRRLTAAGDDEEQAEDQHRNQGQHQVGEYAGRPWRSARPPIVKLRLSPPRPLVGSARSRANSRALA